VVHPTGVLHEAATRLVMGRSPAPDADDLARGFVDIARELLAVGVTGIHDPGALTVQVGLGPATEAYRRLAMRHELPIRVHVSIREEQLPDAVAAGLRSGQPVPDADDGHHLRFGWLKLFADGTLGSRTAAMLAPFEAESDGAAQPGGGLGLWITEPARLAALVREASRAGIVSQIHAIGDAAVRAALDALEGPRTPGAPLPRIEHVQLADPADAGRFGRLGIVASVQPIHLRSDAQPAWRLWGERAEGSGYRLRSLLDGGAVLAFGTDGPVEPVDPWPGIEIAATRRSATWPPGTPAFGAHEAIPVADALRAASVGPAITAGCPDRGRLGVGSVADLAVIPAEALDEAPAPGGPLGRVRPRLVLVGGTTAFER
jgi:predicted amidohydrolase YtcJ